MADTVIPVNIEKVIEHYIAHKAYQISRLDNDSPVEYQITLRKLKRWINSFAKIADVGAGAGHYALQLARQGCQVFVIDIVDDLLDICQHKFMQENLMNQLLGLKNADASDLSFIESETMDAVLLLGPLYHLSIQSERRAALLEAHRLLKKGGVIFAGSINRLAVFKEIWNAHRYQSLDSGKPVSEIKEQLYQLMNDGLTSPETFPPLSSAYCDTVSQFRELFTGYFNELECLGLESFTGHQQQLFLTKETKCQADWLDLIEMTGKTMEGMASSEHFLYIGEKI